MLGRGAFNENGRRRRARRRLILGLGGAALLRMVTAGPLAEPLSTASAAGPAPVAASPITPPTTAAPAAPPSTVPQPAPPAPPATTPPTTAAPKPPPPQPVIPPTTLPTVRAAGVTAAAPSGSVARAGAVGPYKGLGTWIDVYDWSNTYTKNQPTVGPENVAAMAQVGVQTLYVQMARGDTPDDVLEADRLRAIVDQAHAHNMAVVGWYLPYLTNPADDLRHLVAMAQFGIEGVGVDIEAKNVSDTNDRNQRLIDLSSAFRSAAPGLPLAAIVLPPVILEVVNPNYWPGFPWQQIAPFYDVWMPMDYWTNRSQSSGYRDAYRYTSENVIRLRNDIGNPNAAVHPIGGVADEGTPADDDGFLRAAVETHCVGGSVYDWYTTGADEWPHLQGFRS